MGTHSLPAGWLRNLAARFRRKPAPVPEQGGAAFIVVALFAVAQVAVVAFSGSWQHQYELSIHLGQAHWVAGMQPLSVEGLIASATLVIWYAARYKCGIPLGAYLVLAAGVGQTVLMNLGADNRYRWPWLGPEISVWPAVAFVAAYEMAVWLVRKRQEAARRAQPDGTVPSLVPGDAETAALLSLRATLAAGNPWSQNQLQERFSLTRAQAAKVRQLVLSEANGHAPKELDAGSRT